MRENKPPPLSCKDQVFCHKDKKGSPSTGQPEASVLSIPQALKAQSAGRLKICSPSCDSGDSLHQSSWEGRRPSRSSLLISPHGRLMGRVRNLLARFQPPTPVPPSQPHVVLQSQKMLGYIEVGRLTGGWDSMMQPL